ncbi:hypothetical protein HNV11_16150 [Spirosoma taeanense]|uniref:Uncharacterized protein n=1 Tax=Spirosoma taeanense TaxID=2735870 RepID=A0A6M5YED5_9BACT|nr:hypothetical protein HNV11_16150 [Spirosoma taeanense]
MVAVRLASAQPPGPNQAAMDTLTKEVALRVFADIRQPKAQEIYAQLLACGDECDPQQVIRSVGGWDAVGAKMQELSELKSTSRFNTMSPAEANTAIRQQLARFYDKYKNDRNYGRPLSPAAQADILAKIDGLLPPATAPEQPQLSAAQPEADVPADSDTLTEDENSIDGTDLRISQLERQVKSEEEKRLWMMILGAIAGLVVGAGAVYLLAYRSLKAEVERLLSENARLSRSVDAAAQRPRPTNEPRQPPADYKQKADAYDAIRAELGKGVEPLAAIRQLKQKGVNPAPANEPVTRPVVSERSEPVVAPVPAPEPPAAPTPTPPVQMQSQTTARGDVFYFPPPDPTGQFDNAQQMSTLSPESAYRFNVHADRPDTASFRFEAEPGRVTRFLTYRNYMIEPACESENSFSSTHTRIVMRRDGEAALENGSWRVKTKALIRYE